MHQAIIAHYLKSMFKYGSWHLDHVVEMAPGA